jgi:endonuclease/exonuclease/phosphatase family metal-dependent hydrolase
MEGIAGAPGASTGASARSLLTSRQMGRHVSRSVAALTLTVLASCRGDGRDAVPPPELRSTPPATIAVAPAVAAAPDRFRAATYNAGLAVGALRLAEERVAPVVEALSREAVDLLCVQEFWLDEHWQRLTAATASRLPNTVRAAADPAAGSRCTAREVSPIATCAKQRCAASARDGLPMCLLTQCGPALSGLSGGCMSCLARDPRRSLTDLVTECVEPAATKPTASSAKRTAGVAPPGEADPFVVYGGSYGTGILTSAEVLERDTLRFDSALSRRGVLYAKLRTAALGEVHAFCTHLTAHVGDIPRPGRGSWAEDHGREIDALAQYVEEKSHGGPTILLGDLNSGPAKAPNVSPRWADHYQRLVGHGLANAYADADDARCTYCFDNPLDGKSGTRGTIIDHALTRDLPGTVTASPFLRSPLSLEVGGRSVRTGYSDHFGVAITIARPRS